MIVDIDQDAASALRRWRELESRCSGFIFQAPEYISTWFQHFGDNRSIQPAFVFISNRGVTVAGLPLVREQVGMLTRLGFVDYEYGDYSLGLVDGTQAEFPGFAALWQSILAKLPRCDYVDIAKIPVPEATIGTDLSCLPGIRPMATSSHPLHLPAGSTDLLKTCLNPQFRSQMGRRRRRLESMGTVQFEVAPHGEVASRWFMELYEMRRVRFAGLGRSDTLADRERQGFFRDFCTAHHGDLCVMTRLTLDGTPIALQFGFLHNSHYYMILTSFAGGSHATYSPGLLLLIETLRWCGERGVRIYDFTYGDEPYKARFRTIQLPLLQYRRARSVAGWLYLGADTLRNRAGHLWDRYL